MLDILWLLLIIYLVLIAIYFSKKLNFKNYKLKGILNKETLILSMGTKMGVGSIIGSAAALFIGGPSTLLWIWIFTLITSSLLYVESILGSQYKEKKNSSFIGGIYHYTFKCTNNKKLASLLIILFIFTYSILFLMIQTNTIYNILNINKYILSIIIMLLITMLITNNLNEIKKIISYIVPFICTLYLIICIYIILKNVNILPLIIPKIFSFNSKSIIIGLLIGIKRSIFINEILIGTASYASSQNNESAITNARSLIIGSFFITFIITTLTFIILLIYMHDYPLNYNYLNLLINAFNYYFNKSGYYLLSLIICLLASSSIINGLLIGLVYINIFIKNKLVINTIKIVMVIAIISGIFININLIWYLLDIIMFILILLNSIIVFKLRNMLEYT